METEAFFQEKVYLTPKDLRNDIESVDDILVLKLKERLEQRCSPHGYVMPGTLEILTRSTGMVDSGRFSGDWAFLVKAKGHVLNPPEGTMVEVEVLKSNKMGVYAVYENAIRLMVPRDLHLGDEEFDALKVGDRIKVEIQKSRFQLRDPFIVSVGIYRGMSGAPTRMTVPSVNTAAPVNEVISKLEDEDVSGDEEAVVEGTSGAEEEDEEETKEE
uniref:S1 motif domain-containing protein n=1 Tax=viral metagenome TaxID=1070528 RepID=A0A6C0DJ10_9ZZZZ